MPPDIGSIRQHRQYVVTSEPRNGVEQLVAITAHSESGHLSYAALNRDDAGKGVSFGRFQFNQAATLGDLLQRMYDADPAKFVALTFGDSRANPDPDHLARELLKQMRKSETKLEGSLSSQLSQRQWRSRWKALGAEPQFQRVQEKMAADYYFDPAKQIAKDFGLKSERSLALIFDMCIQHGTGGARAMVARAYRANPDNARELKNAAPEQRPHEEHDMLVLIAKQTVNAGGPQWVANIVHRREAILKSAELSDLASPITAPRTGNGLTPPTARGVSLRS